jgi:hypothetical protein
LADVLDRRVVVELERSPLVIFDSTRKTLFRLIVILDHALVIMVPLLEQLIL